MRGEDDGVDGAMIGIALSGLSSDGLWLEVAGARVKDDWSKST